MTFFFYVLSLDMDFLEITTLKGLERACEYYKDKPILGIDTETGNCETGEGVFEPRDGDLSVIQMADAHKTVIIDVFALYEEAGIPKIVVNGVTQYDSKKGFYLFKALKKILENPTIKLVIHNAKFEHKWFIAKCNIYCNSVFDSYIAAILIDYNPGSEPAKMHNLGAVMRRYVGQNLDKAEQKSNWGARPLTAEQKQYAADDVKYSVILREKLYELLTALSLHRVCKIEFDATIVVAKMELRGMKVNRKEYEKEIIVLMKLRDKAQKALQARVHKEDSMVQTSLFGLPEKDFGEVLLTSSSQMKLALNKLDIPIFAKKEIELFELYRTEERFINSLSVNDKLAIMKEKYPKFDFGLYETYKQAIKENKQIIEGTGAKALLSVDKNEHDVLKVLQEFRGVDKQCTAYGYSFLNHLVGYEVGHERVHPSFKQIGAPTGRFSCFNPNCQQIPAGKVTVDGEKHNIRFREAFDFPEGRVGINADYSQIELRIAAFLSNDPDMIETFESGRDLHADTASKVFGVEYELCAQDGHEYYNTYRKYSKSINFGIVYGMGAGALSAQINVTVEEAQEMIDKYASTYKVLWEYLRKQFSSAVKTLQARTASGRLQQFTEPNKDENGQPIKFEIGAIGRNGMNMPIQGLSADILKRSLKILDDALEPYDAFIVNIVHDEIMVETALNANTEAVRKIVEDSMIAAAKEFITTVPIKVDAKVVKNWSDK